jgi:putative endonuclease
MSKHSETGARGERLAEEFLVTNGYQVLHRNWRNAHKEVDLIALDGDTLVFFEIKTRSGLGFGYPEEAVNGKKQGHLRAAAQQFSFLFPEYDKFRFDVISIILKGDFLKDLRHLKDAF